MYNKVTAIIIIKRKFKDKHDGYLRLRTSSNYFRKPEGQKNRLKLQTPFNNFWIQLERIVNIPSILPMKINKLVLSFLSLLFPILHNGLINITRFDGINYLGSSVLYPKD